MVQKMALKSKKKNKDGGANSNYSRIYSSQQQQKLAENAAAAGVSKNTGGIVGGRQFDFRAKFSGSTTNNSHQHTSSQFQPPNRRLDFILDDYPPKSTVAYHHNYPPKTAECTQCHGTGKLTATSVPSLPFDVNINGENGPDSLASTINSEELLNGGKNRRSNSCDRLSIYKDNSSESKSAGSKISLLKRPSFKDRFTLNHNSNSHNSDNNPNNNGGRKHSLKNPLSISNKIAGIVGTGTKILRRHTTYIRNPSTASLSHRLKNDQFTPNIGGLNSDKNVDLDADSLRGTVGGKGVFSVAVNGGSSTSGHVHSWIRNQDDNGTNGTGSVQTHSLKRSLLRNPAASSYNRLSTLFKKDESGLSNNDPTNHSHSHSTRWSTSTAANNGANGDIVSVCCASDAQSLDRLSIQTQEGEIFGGNEDFNWRLGRGGRAADWAKDFDNLLSDRYGLNKFTEFLRQEFSHENIYFWSAAERYRLIESVESGENGGDIDNRRRDAAKNILRRHLAPGAVDPVNLDAASRLRLLSNLEKIGATIETASQIDEEGFSVSVATEKETQTGDNLMCATPQPDLFLQAQNQIYNLMKYDSYPRFLKSRLYTDCVRREMTGSSLSAVTLTGTTASSEIDDVIVDDLPSTLPRGNKSAKDSGPSKGRNAGNRLSVFWDNTWGRKDGGNSGGNHAALGCSAVNSGDMTADLLKHGNHREGHCTLTRVILPNGSTSVVTTTSGESIRALVSRLLEKRGLKIANFEVYSTGGDESSGTGGRQFDLSEDCCTLGCTEVRVEQRISFKICGIPTSTSNPAVSNYKTLNVKTRTYKQIRDVLAPLLHPYNLELAINPAESPRNGGAIAVNVVTEDGAWVDLNRDVSTIENKRLFVQPCNGGKSSMFGGEVSALTDNDNGPTPSAEISLYEGLQIMRRGRFEDQRGTEIRFEIPDFLKLPQSSDSPQSSKSTPTVSTSTPQSSKAPKVNKDSIQMTPIKKEVFNDSSPTLGFV